MAGNRTLRGHASLIILTASSQQINTLVKLPNNLQDLNSEAAVAGACQELPRTWAGDACFTAPLTGNANSVTLHDTISIRVQYNETDGQGRVHHAQYLNYFERGRVELLRSRGYSYREFEASGLMLVVAEMNVKYLGAAQFDDLLHLTTRVVRSRGVRIEHAYELTRVHAEQAVPEIIVTALSTIACVDRSGKVRRLPEYLRTT